MCGIAGIFHHDRSQPVDPETLVAMAAIQHHRGPDDFGWHVMDEQGVGFSHARLAIIDLDESGRQPFVSADERLMTTHNGEFYDFQRLRASLSTAGARFRTKSDSELLLHLYPKLDLFGMLHHLRGEFAFGMYDKERDRLILVRDRFGIKPLYWTRTDDGIVFGSEVKVLFAHPGVDREFNPEGVYHQLMQTMVPGTTAFKDVHQVAPGTAVIFQRRGDHISISEHTWWDMDFPQAEEHAADDRSEEELVEGVRSNLIEAVGHRLVADVPVACYLSGGIDSCSMLGLSASMKQDPVKAFTIGFDNKEYDESDIAQRMADSVGAEQDIMMLDASLLYDNFVETHWHTERTIYNTLAVAKLLMSRHVNKAGYKVVVTGEGSDELFGGYPGFKRDYFAHGLDHLPANERADLEALLQKKNKLFSGSMLAPVETIDRSLESVCGFTPSSLQPWLAASLRVPALLSPQLRTSLASYDPGTAIAEALDPEKIMGRHPLDVAQYVWIKTMLEGQILTWGGDRVDMANSMESRPAFLDHHLAEFAASIPPRYRIKGTTEKYVLREAMKGVLPEELYKREKFAFMAPPAHTDPHKHLALKELSGEYLNPKRLEEDGLLDPLGVSSMMTLHEDDKTPWNQLVQLDALMNHMLGVQILKDQLVNQDIPGLARKQAEKLGWSAYERA
jgi:asparagine synthase (glutamine-hydrolysing)